MKTILASAALAAAVALTATGASAAPFAGLGKAVGASDAAIVKVHGVHRECVEGRMGWHRSTPWGGRIVCTPPWRKHHRYGYGHGHGHGHGYGHDNHPQPRVIVKPEPRYEPRYEPKPAPRVEVRPNPRSGGPRHAY